MATTTKAVVIGAGYIGVEVATAFAEAGIDVTVIDRVDRILPTYLAPEIASLLEEHAQEKGLKFAGGEAVVKLTGKDGKVNGVVTDKAEYEADMVVIAVGVRPGTAWLKGALDIDEDGFILTNDHMETSAKDVYAGGDATYITYAPTGTKENIGLATLARRQGIVAALNATGKPYQMPSVSGTSALRFFDYTITTTGLNSMNKDRYQGNVAEAYVKEKVYPDFMRKPGSVHMKLFYDADTHVILGAQLVSKIDIADSINTLSIAIQSKYTLQDLALVDFFYQPNYDRPWHYLNVLAIEALNNTVGGADKLLF